MSQFFASNGFSFGTSPSNEYSGLISFRMDWLDLLAVEGTLKSLLQYHSSKASILQNSPFFIVQLSRPYRTTGKTITLTVRKYPGWWGVAAPRHRARLAGSYPSPLLALAWPLEWFSWRTTLGGGSWA